MTVLKCLAAATLLLSVSACGPSYQAYRSDAPYSPAAYGYNQQSTYYQTRYVDGQPTYTSRQPSNYGYGYAQPTYGYGYQAQPTYYGYQQQPTYTYYTR
jgi:hypothetical protein